MKVAYLRITVYLFFCRIFQLANFDGFSGIYRTLNVLIILKWAVAKCEWSVDNRSIERVTWDRHDEKYEQRAFLARLISSMECQHPLAL